MALHASGDRLPIRPVKRQKGAKSSGREPGRPRRILMIEDDGAVAEMYAFRLRQEGWRVDIAASGEEGIKLAINHPPDLVLLDMVLPGIDGVEVLRRLRHGKHTRNLSAVVLSNSPGFEARLENAKALGITGWLTKATTMPEDLVAYLRRVFQ